MTNPDTAALIATLTAVHGGATDALNLPDGSYLDWSVRADGGRCLEVGGADGTSVQLDLSRAELLQLHAALTLTLIADQG